MDVLIRYWHVRTRILSLTGILKEVVKVVSSYYKLTKSPLKSYLQTYVHVNTSSHSLKMVVNHKGLDLDGVAILYLSLL